MLPEAHFSPGLAWTTGLFPSAESSARAVALRVRAGQTALGGERVAGFYGWKVGGAGVLPAVFGWGLVFHGPPVYLHAVQARGFSLTAVSAAVTVHFLLGAL